MPPSEDVSTASKVLAAHAAGSSPAPLVTIGLPVYNGARHLEAAIRSLLDQTARDFTLVISDNCSTDETPRICERFAAEDPRIRYVRQEKNLGPMRNYEYLIRTATTPYFTWAADDDIRPPQYLAEALRLLAAAPDAVGCAMGVRLVDEAGSLIEQVSPPDGLASATAVVRARAVRQRGHLAIYGLLCMGRLPSDLTIPNLIFPDGIFVHRLAMQGPFVVTQEPLLTFLFEPAGAQRGKPEAHLYAEDTRWRETHRVMLRDTRRAPIPLLQKMLVSAYILWLDAHDAYRITKTQKQRALEERRRVQVLLFSTKLAALSPFVAARAVKETIGRWMARLT
jgi:glycosyltransferase involved in cell wall biosynthesis